MRFPASVLEALTSTCSESLRMIERHRPYSAKDAFLPALEDLHSLFSGLKNLRTMRLNKILDAGVDLSSSVISPTLAESIVSLEYPTQISPLFNEDMTLPNLTHLVLYGELTDLVDINSFLRRHGGRLRAMQYAPFSPFRAECVPSISTYCPNMEWISFRAISWADLPDLIRATPFSKLRGIEMSALLWRECVAFLLDVLEHITTIATPIFTTIRFGNLHSLREIPQVFQASYDVNARRWNDILEKFRIDGIDFEDNEGCKIPHASLVVAQSMTLVKCEADIALDAQTTDAASAEDVWILLNA